MLAWPPAEKMLKKISSPEKLIRINLFRA